MDNGEGFSGAHETTYYRYCRNIYGELVPVDVAKHNGRRVPHIPREATEIYLLPNSSEAPDYVELVEELCQGLRGIAKRRWLMAISDGMSISDISTAEGVSRQAIIDSFRRMALKNPYVSIWIRHKKKTNQYR